MTLIFDIGKTNKKYFLFDDEFNTIESDSLSFDEIVDDDGYPCDDIEVIKTWILEVYKGLLSKYVGKLSYVNISSYGASIVHLDKDFKIVTPLYNYIKPVDDSIFKPLYNKYKGVAEMSRMTGSPKLELLNSGFQLYWLKITKEKIYSKISYSLHLPNYLSYLFHNVLLSEYTSIGCHTAMWNFDSMKYHQWINDEKITDKFSSIVKGDSKYEIANNIHVGTGLHDSSAALIPYIKTRKSKFILLSTGTWSIAFNPFNNEALTTFQLTNDCLTYLSIDGAPVVASRLFLGHEHEFQITKLNAHFGVDPSIYKSIKYNANLTSQMMSDNRSYFCLQHLGDEAFKVEYCDFSTYEIAYHRLMLEMVKKQIFALNLILSKTDKIDELIIDGGFVNNDLYCKMLNRLLPEFKVYRSNLKSGAAIGAALCINPNLERKLGNTKNMQITLVNK
ncbi:MAG: FGGY family carbohydrate kinase [Saprospiraceae bacterium]